VLSGSEVSVESTIFVFLGSEDFTRKRFSFLEILILGCDFLGIFLSDARNATRVALASFERRISGSSSGRMKM
jgi:hypothetical protein